MARTDSYPWTVRSRPSTSATRSSMRAKVVRNSEISSDTEQERRGTRSEHPRQGVLGALNGLKWVPELGDVAAFGSVGRSRAAAPAIRPRSSSRDMTFSVRALFVPLFRSAATEALDAEPQARGVDRMDDGFRS